MTRPTIVVVGSANTDLTVVAERLPAPGETVLGGRLVTAGGGKGANQAVAAARAGAAVAFVGCIGDDAFGRQTLEELRCEGINTDHLRIEEHEPSGVALIVVDARGENLIAVAPGANASVAPTDVEAARGTMAAADMVMVQLEVPLQAVRAAMSVAREEGVPVLLDPAPAPAHGAGLVEGADFVTPNATEAARLLGMQPAEGPEEPARRLVEAGVRAAFVTLGAEGVCVCEGGRCVRVPAPRVEALDTVGAGDCFAGALAVALAEGAQPVEAARFAVCAAALAVQQFGARPAMPHRAEIERVRAEHSRT